MNNFFNTLKKVFAPPVFEGDEEKTRVAALLNFITLAYFIATTSVTSLGFLASNNLAETTRTALALLTPLLVILVVSQILMRRGLVQIASVFFAVTHWLNVTWGIYTGGGIESTGLFGYLLSLLIFGLLLGSRFATINAITSFITATIFMIVGNQGLLPDPVVERVGIAILLTFAVQIFLGAAFLYQYLRRLNETLSALEEAGAALERRVADRTKALETSAEVSRRLTAILDPRDLAKAVVEQVQTAFDYYYAQIYMFDETAENLVLTAGTGEAGTEMMKRGHALPKGRGLVGRAAENNKSILVADTSQDPDWLPNELLPDTKAEAVVPIMIGDHVFGVLDVQDDATDDITSDDITLLESLAGQVAISLQNAESYARADAALQEARSLVENAAEGIAVLDLTTGLFTESNVNAEKIYGLSHDELMKVGPGQMSPPTQPDGRDSNDAAMEMIGIAMEKGINIFEWNHINAQGDEFPCEIRLVRLPGDHPRIRVSITDITERQALQKLTAQRARQQEAINTITQRIQAATTIEEAMQVAARELGHALGQKQTAVSLEASALGGNGNTSGNK